MQNHKTEHNKKQESLEKALRDNLRRRKQPPSQSEEIDKKQDQDKS